MRSEVFLQETINLGVELLLESPRTVGRVSSHLGRPIFVLVLALDSIGVGLEALLQLLNLGNRIQIIANDLQKMLEDQGLGLLGQSCHFRANDGV